MTATFRCPHCGHTVLAEEAAEVPQGLCAACGKAMIVPGHESATGRAEPKPVLFGLSSYGLILVCVCVGTVLAVLITALGPAIESARVNSCICHGKNIGLSLHNYHDIHARLPLASTAPVTARPGDPVEAGYSWLVQILPFIEEQPLYDEIAVRSEDFKKPPFDPTILDEQPVKPNVWSPLSIFVCPNTSESSVDEHASFVYKMLPLPGISNYIATTTSHLTTRAGPLELSNYGTSQKGLSGNGVLVFPAETQQTPATQLSLKSITNGTSKTLVFCESRETTYAAWMDGQVTWGIAAWPRNEVVPTISDDGYLGWPRSDTSGITSLKAAVEEGPLNFYLEGKRFGRNSDRKFGPSSNHARGKVLHCFADGHVLMILSDEVDRNTYLRLYTRSGGWPIPID